MKKILSVLLSVLMVAGMLSVTVFAHENAMFDDFEQYKVGDPIWYGTWRKVDSLGTAAWNAGLNYKDATSYSTEMQGHKCIELAAFKGSKGICGYKPDNGVAPTVENAVLEFDAMLPSYNNTGRIIAFIVDGDSAAGNTDNSKIKNYVTIDTNGNITAGKSLFKNYVVPLNEWCHFIIYANAKTGKVRVYVSDSNGQHVFDGTSADTGNVFTGIALLNITWGSGDVSNTYYDDVIFKASDFSFGGSMSDDFQGYGVSDYGKEIPYGKWKKIDPTPGATDTSIFGQIYRTTSAILDEFDGRKCVNLKATTGKGMSGYKLYDKVAPTVESAVVEFDIKLLPHTKVGRYIAFYIDGDSETANLDNSKLKQFFTIDTNKNVTVAGTINRSYVFPEDKWCHVKIYANAKTGVTKALVDDGELHKFEGISADKGKMFTGIALLSMAWENGVDSGTYFDNFVYREYNEAEEYPLGTLNFSKTTLEPGEITATITGRAATDVGAKLILALYENGTNRLAGVQCVEMPFTAENDNYSAKLNIPETGSYIVKAYLWEGNLTPLRDPEVLK